MAKNYFNRYIWLIDVINRHGHISREDISYLWARSPLNEAKENYLPERTFHNHVDSIYDTFGIEIKCDRSLGYYIANSDDMEGDGIKQWLMHSLSLNNLLNESSDMRESIIFEEVPSSEKYLTTIIEAIRDGKALEITYQGFNKDYPSTFEVRPYCLKAFKQRWYMVAKTAASSEPWIYGLDRIQNLKRTDVSYKIPKKFSAREYFKSLYGVCIEDSKFAEDVILKVTKSQVNYLKSLKLHSSQEVVEENEKFSIFKVHLVPTFDFTKEILSMGANVQVMAPQWYRNEIKEKIAAMMAKYND